MSFYSRPVVSSGLWSGNAYTPGGVLQGADVIKQRILLAVTTSLGSDPLRPFFGANSKDYVSRPLIVAATGIKKEITDTITLWVPEVELKQITYTTEATDGGKVYNRLVFTIRTEWNNTDLTVQYGVNRLDLTSVRDKIIASCVLPYLRPGKSYKATLILRLYGVDSEIVVYEGGFASGAAIAVWGNASAATYGYWGSGQDTTIFYSDDTRVAYAKLDVIAV